MIVMQRGHYQLGRLAAVRWRPEWMVDDDQMRRRGFAVRHIGGWLVTWCRRPQDWRF